MIQKIFCIGLSRTGTLSLAHALSKLGYRSYHFPDRDELYDEFDAFSDTPVAYQYQKLDKLYPNSKFILTVRDLGDWLDSCKALWDSHEKDFGEFVSYIHLKLYGRLDYDEKSFAEAYEHHLLDVIYYFRKRKSDLLIMNVCAGDGWEKLCPFLNIGIPSSINFPSVNGREFLFKDGEWQREHEAKP